MKNQSMPRKAAMGLVVRAAEAGATGACSTKGHASVHPSAATAILAAMLDAQLYIKSGGKTGTKYSERAMGYDAKR